MSWQYVDQPVKETEMNIAQINAFRVSQGLAPIAVKAGVSDAKKRQAANQAARAAACRELKSKRSKGGK